MAKLFIEDLPLQGKKVLVRVDFNVPIDSAGHIINDTRIRAALPTIRYILRHGAIPILMSHLGRPKENRPPELSMKPVADALSHILEHSVIFIPDCIGSETKNTVNRLKPGDMALLENLRYYPAEEHPETDPQFAEQLASLGDLYIDDAFGAAHRKHSSIVNITSYFPGRAAAGFLLNQELHYLSYLLHNPKRPFCALLGGAKISTKIGILQSLLERVDFLMLGGAMAYTFIEAQGITIGNSLVENDFLEQAQALLEKFSEKIVLPIDTVATEKIISNAPTKIFPLVPGQGVGVGYQGCDIGPQTIAKFQKKLCEAKTIVWNGPMGVYEVEPFDQGTLKLAHSLASLSATTVVGGGDLIAAIQKSHTAPYITHISTGGGATLEFLQYGTLPGIEALSDKETKAPL